MTRTLSQTMVETNPGTVLAGKYRVERVLGTGGMGVVVAALHEQLDERVAIKLLRADRLAQADAVERALREARATVKIQSDHVVRVFDVGTLENGSPYIVMEYLAGCDLAQLLCAEGKLDVADACSYVRQACDAVGKAHAIGIIHRDLKPANMFLAVRDDKSAIKVLDFGISKFVSTDSHRVSPSLTSTASVLGSPAYMSPEQLESPREIDARTDIWGLGVILFELLTGAHPFVADTLPQLYKKIADEPAPSVKSIRPDVPVDLDAIVARCLAKKPADRFADVASLARVLAPFAVDASDERKLAGLAETASASREEIESARLASKISGPAIANIDAPLATANSVAAANAVAAGASANASGVGTSTSEGRGQIEARGHSDARGQIEARAGISMGVERTQARRRRLAWSGFAFAGLAALATSTLVCVRADSQRRTASAKGDAGNGAAGGAAGRMATSPLKAAGSVLACPPLVASGVEQPAGWLGAAAASIACTRATVRMGNRAERTLLPAELLDLPRTVVDNFPEDAFSAADARERAIAAAKTRGQAWLDGSIDHTADGFTVELVLRVGDRELAHGSGRSATLVPAIHDAMAPIDRFVPAARDDDPFLREWMGARTADAAVAIAEWSIGNRLEWPNKSGCEALSKNPDILPITQKAIHNWCIPEPQDYPDRDTELPGTLVASITADGQLSKRPLDAELARIEKALAITKDRQARAFLLAAKSEIFTGHRMYPEATQAALESIGESADAFFPWTTGWNAVAWTRANSNAAPASLAWTPWNVEVYCFAATRAAKTDDGIAYMRRNTVLSHGSIWKEALVEFLVHGNKVDEARSLAAKLPTDPVNLVVDAAEGHFAQATERAEMQMKDKDPEVAVNAAYYMSDLAVVTGKPARGTQELIERFVDKHPEQVKGNVLIEINVALVCMKAQRDIAKHCFQRLREMTGGVVFFDVNFLDGAERYSQGDFAGAAKAWRALLARPDWHLFFMHDTIADAFERGNDPENAARVDARYLRDGRFNGAEMAHVREARRAEKRGDAAQARAMAKKVIDAWSVVDVDVPAVAEMRQLIARLDKKPATSH
ncbi:MAG TPA: serine/threonine-protein kinase [Kofleriaceae bacterium]|nr:serine/threonine-protein kinase [Kofleriaceae bacterium]